VLLHVPNVLSDEQVAACRDLLGRAAWRDGRITAGVQSARVKANQQIEEGSAEARALGDLVVRALERNPLFIAASLPRHVFPPLFNRYEPGMSFGTHIDNAIRQAPGAGGRIRTDVSATLFLSCPEEYDGGELIVEDSYGAHRVRLPAGDMALYPASSLHSVSPVKSGVRLAAVFWVQSMVRDDGQRALLFDLDTAIRDLSGVDPDSPALVRLTGCYHNLLRRWAEM
jgi:PKHD-type hydroxylase